MPTYNNAIPQPGDDPSQSQDQILQNFQVLDTAFKVDHDAYNDPNEGKHKKVTFNDQTANLPISVIGSDLTMYLANDPGFPTLGQQLWIKSSGGFINAITASNNATGGFSTMVSGIGLAWATVTWASAGNHTINLDSSSFGASFPGFATAVYNIQLTSKAASNQIYVVSVGAGPTYTLTYNVTATSGSAYLSVIGI